MPIRFDLSKYKTSTFIETGTYSGEGIRKALEAGFTDIRSIELDPNMYTANVEQFKNFPQVKIYHGDSALVLPQLLKEINYQCTFWLDAHYSGGPTQSGPVLSPIVDELKVIEQHSVKNHILLIDDYRQFDYTGIDPETKKEWGFPGKLKLLDLIRQINPKYTITFIQGIQVGDVVCATFDS